MMLRLFCALGFHAWEENGKWAARVCKHCPVNEVKYYDRENGAYWKRVP